MVNLKRFVKAPAGLCVLLGVLAIGGGAAFAATTSHLHRHHAHATRTSALRERAIRQLIARKRRQGRAHAHATAGLTYPELGVSVGPPSSAALKSAAASPLGSANAAVLAAQQQGPFTDATGATAMLASVTDQHAITTGISDDVPYEAWVVTGTGPCHSTQPGPPMQCQDVAIYSLQFGTWTEFLQTES
jgi:hypothetical protein